MKDSVLPCVCAAGVGEKDVKVCKMRQTKGREALRAVFDKQGRWQIHWREADGKEWIGTYRLLPC